MVQVPQILAQWRMAPAREQNPINSNLIQKKGYEVLTTKKYFSEAIPEVLKEISSVKTHFNLTCNEFYYSILCYYLIMSS
jgi:hypothetical protein